MELNGIDIENQIKELKDYFTEKNFKYFLQVNVLLEAPIFGLSDLIRDGLNDKNIDVLNIHAVFKNENLQEEEDFTISQNLASDIPELFKIFYKEKTGSEDVPEKISKEFIKLLDKTNYENR